MIKTHNFDKFITKMLSPRSQNDKRFIVGENIKFTYVDSKTHERSERIGVSLRYKKRYKYKFVVIRGGIVELSTGQIIVTADLIPILFNKLVEGLSMYPDKALDKLINNTNTKWGTVNDINDIKLL